MRQNGTLAQQLAQMQARMTQLTGLLEVQKVRSPQAQRPGTGAEHGCDGEGDEDAERRNEMIKVNYTELDGPAGPTCRLEASGHAGYAPPGRTSCARGPAP